MLQEMKSKRIIKTQKQAQTYRRPSYKRSTMLEGTGQQSWAGGEGWQRRGKEKEAQSPCCREGSK